MAWICKQNGISLLVASGLMKIRGSGDHIEITPMGVIQLL